MFKRNKPKQNYISIMPGAYLVKNENAMYQALYEYMRKDNYSKKSVRTMLRWVPTYYPAFVVFHDQSFDAGRILMYSMHLNKLKYWAMGLLVRTTSKLPCRRNDNNHSGTSPNDKTNGI